MRSTFEAGELAEWVEFADEAFDQSDVFREGFMSEAEVKRLVEDNPEDCIGYSFHSGNPKYRWVVRKGTVKFGNEPGWTCRVFKVKLPTAKQIHLFIDDFAETPEALADVDPGHGWARPGRDEGLGDARQDLEMIQGISPNDLRQGGLGDCWLISAFAALAEFPEAVKRIVHPRSLARDGKYTVSLLNYAHGRVEQVEVDDRIPKGKYDEPAFTGITRNDEIWPCIFEKAVAKLAGSYERLNGGDPVFAMGLLTGCRDLIEFHQTRQLDWICIQPEYKSSNPHSQANRMLYGKWPDGTEGGTGREWTDILKYLAEYDAKDYLMCCGSHAGSDTDSNSFGVVQGHAYTILTVVLDVAGSGRHLLQLRNPWGQGEWTGDWSDSSELWSLHPDIKEALGYKPAKDGIFWIEARDFFRNYSSVMVCCKDMGKNRSKKHGQRRKQQGTAGESQATAELRSQAAKLRQIMEFNEKRWLEVLAALQALRQDCSALVSQKRRTAEDDLE